MKTLTTVLACLLLAASVVDASAQPPGKPAPATVPVDPAQTTATYGDWVLRCVRHGESGRVRACELMQSVVLQGQQQPVAQIAIGNAEKGEPMRLTVVVPAAISLAKGAQITTEAGGTALHQLTWRRCLPGGCFADVVLNAETLKSLRARIEPLHLSFKDAADRDVVLPFSLRGLSQALDALSKESLVR